MPVFVFSCITRGVLLTHHIALGDSWTDGVVLGLGVGATFLIISQRLPAQNWIAIGTLTILLSGAFEWALCQGNYVLPPWALPLVWAIALINARGTGQWMLRPWRASWGYGFWLFGITSALAALCVTAISLLTGQAEAEDSLWSSLALRFTAACIILIFNATLLIPKSPHPRPLEKGAVTLWLTFNLLLIAAAAIQGLWWLSSAGILVNTIIYLLSREQRVCMKN